MTFVSMRKFHTGMKSGLTLVIRVDWDLMIPRITIKETKERVLCKPFQHFINEG
jgi:hypothetical protein